MPGPIVERIVTPLMYLPLAADGFAVTTLVMTVIALSTSFCGSNESLPTGTWTSAVLSVRNSTLPALISLTAPATSVVTVPVFGLGISPLGPRTLPRRPTDFIMSGVAIRASKAVQCSFWIFSTSSSPPKNSAPAASASLIRSPEAITATTLDLPRPCGRTTVPRTIWSACLGSTPRRMVRSTVSSNFAYFAFCRSGSASTNRYGRGSTSARAFTRFLESFLAIFPRLPPLGSCFLRTWFSTSLNWVLRHSYKYAKDEELVQGSSQMVVLSRLLLGRVQSERRATCSDQG